MSYEIKNLTKEEWLKLRRTGITGTDVAPICGLSPFSNSVEIYNKKLGLQPETEMNQAMHFGVEFETIVADYYKKHVMQDKIHFCPEHISDKYYQLVSNPTYPDFFASPDRVCVDEFGDKYILEVKTTTNLSSYFGEEDFCEAMPAHYLCQLIFYCAILDLPYAHLVCLHSTSKIKTAVYHRNKALEDELLATVQKFYDDHILKQIPPEEAHKTELPGQYKAHDLTAIEANEEVYEKALRLIDCRNKRVEIETEEKDLKAWFASNFENSVITDALGEELLTVSTQNSKRFDAKNFKAANNELYEKFLKDSPSTVIRVKG